MRQKRTLSLIILTFTIMSVMIFSEVAYADSIRSIKLNGGKDIYLEIDDEKTLPIVFSPEDAESSEVEFSSSNDSIVSIDRNGKVTAHKTGRVTLTAELGNLISSIRATVYEKTDLTAVFSESIVVADKVANITISVDSEDEAQTQFNIFLPSGYLVTGSTATFAVNANGTYPFTVYDNSGVKKTFYYVVDSLSKSINSEDDDDGEVWDEFDIDILFDDLKLQYDYEEKEYLFNAELDKIRTVTLPNNRKIETKEINYFIGEAEDLENGEIIDYSFDIEGKVLNCKLIRQGEFFLLIILEDTELDDRYLYHTYRAYNFTLSQPSLLTSPTTEFLIENGNYEVLAYTSSGMKEVFNYVIENIDFMRPDVDLVYTYENKFELIVEDNIALDYIIAPDGKYYKIPASVSAYDPYTFLFPTPFTFDGEYVFSVVDTSGNKTVVTGEVDDIDNILYVGNTSLDVHNYPDIYDYFESTGEKFVYAPQDNIYYENVFPSYMRGISETKFSPYGTLSRAQAVTILSRVTDLPYDINLINKTNFTDISNHWARHYISMASSKRYIQGLPDKTFRPDNELSRADFCVIINNVSALKDNIEDIPAVYNHSVTDINTSFAYAKLDILKLVNRDIIKVDGGEFHPDKPITRAEVIYAINRLYGLSPSNEEFEFIENLYETYFDFNDISNHPYYEDLVISIVGMYRER